jgi:acyl carrier protein
MNDITSGETEARNLVAEAIRRIVPDADLDTVGDDSPLRAEFELDSLDFLSFAETLAQRSGVDITEGDYDRLVTMRTCVEFLTGGDRGGRGQGPDAEHA